MAYEYDAFFSYKRDRESDEWHERVKNKLIFWLKQELQRQDVRIFFDTEEIRTGARWRQKLADALKKSRCIVCVWSPLYFQSQWCISEWKTFIQREQQTQRDLVMPASYFDGETFPPDATAKQFLDFSTFASTMPKFWETELAVHFEEQLLKPFAHDLAAMVRSAPPYNDAFPIVEVPNHQVADAGTIERTANV
jgi:TIR domain